MQATTIRVERNDTIAVIRLHRPGRMNAVIEEMYRELQEALAVLGSDPEVRALVLTGSALERNGVRKQAFCAGADLKKHVSGDRDREAQRRYIELAHATTKALVQLPKPVVAAVNGPARGAGTEIALACDLVLMADDATMALPELGLGTFVGGGVTHLLPKVVGLAQARELVYTGRVVDGREAAAMGLVLRACPLESLMDEATALATRLAAAAPIPMARAKDLLQRSPALDLVEALDLETEAILACMATDDWHEGHRAFAEKRHPRFEGK